MLRNSSKNHLDNQCQECGCHCDSCVNNNSIHLHQEIESLKYKLKEREQQIVAMESQILIHANQYPNGEIQALRDNLYHWQDKYERLLENYRKLQKVNQGLEDKLLRVADRFENERIILTQNVGDLTNKLNQAQNFITNYQKEMETFKNDFELLLRFIQNQSQSSIDIDFFPEEFQNRVRQYIENRSHQSEEESVRVPIPTFPPTAVLYSLNQSKKTDQEDIKSSKLSSSIFSQIFKENSKVIQCQNCSEKFCDSSKLISPPNVENSKFYNNDNNKMTII